MTSEKDLNNVTKDLQKRSNREFKDKNTCMLVQTHPSNKS